MIKTALNIFLIVGYVAGACYIAYKIMMFLMDKMCALIKKSKWFRVLVCFVISIICVAAGVFKLEDYSSGKGDIIDLFMAFICLITSLVLLYYTFLAYKDKRGKID